MERRIGASFIGAQRVAAGKHQGDLLFRSACGHVSPVLASPHDGEVPVDVDGIIGKDGRELGDLEQCVVAINLLLTGYECRLVVPLFYPISGEEIDDCLRVTSVE